MSINSDEMMGMSISEMISFLNEKRVNADKKRKQIEKLRNAIETTKSHVTGLLEENNEDIDFDNLNEDDYSKEFSYYLSEFLKLKEYTMETISSILPPRSNYDYDNIVLYLMASCTHDLKDIREIIATCGSNMTKEDLKEYKEEAELLGHKREILKEILLSEVEDVSINNERNKLVFMPIKGTGKIRIFDELKDIPHEEYDGFIELLDSIKDGKFKNIRRFTNNDLLNGALEVKGFQIRILFKQLSEDTYAIISLFTKKVQNSQGYRKPLQAKYGEYMSMEKELKEKVKDPTFMQQNEEYEKQVYDILSEGEYENKGGCK